jgi:hypothetical protein
MYDITVCEDVEDTYKLASVYLHDDKSSYSDLKHFMSDHDIWVDEWVRRSNGDRYITFVPHFNIFYKLSVLHQREDIKEAKNSEKIQYIFLRIKVDNSKRCPENIEFWLSFHSTLVNAIVFAKNQTKWDTDFTEETPVFDRKDRKKLYSLEPVWIEAENKRDPSSHIVGDFYQIIPISLHVKIDLHRYCSYIQPKNWISYR